MHDDKRFGTRCVHAGQHPDPTTGAITTPIYMTSTYVQKSPGVFKDGYDYSRSKNPTRQALEDHLAALEGGARGLSFSSGLASIDCVLHLLSSGDHVILCDDVYGGTFRLFKRVFEQLGISFTRVDMTNPEATRDAFTDTTRLVWLETPTNPTLKIIDIEQMAAIAHAKRALLAVDNTFATPALQNPLKLGADIVSHSSTKYIGGHADLVGGALIARDKELGERLWFNQNLSARCPARWTASSSCARRRPCTCACSGTARTRCGSPSTSPATPPSRGSSTPGSSRTRSTRSRSARCAGSAGW
ncbi:MAG: aminotransferase class V-fold PLP-dependent enzyme [Phycisphaerales bacterium]